MLEFALRPNQSHSVADAIIQVTFDIDDLAASLLIGSRGDLSTVAIAEAFQTKPLALLEKYMLQHIRGFQNNAQMLQKVREEIAQTPGLDLTLAYVKGGKSLEASQLLAHFANLDKFCGTPDRKKHIAQQALAGKIKSISECMQEAR